MQKIMFNDKYGLTQAVLEGRKTMTRRLAEKILVEDIDQRLVWTGEFKKPKYKPGEVVAVAQSYGDVMMATGRQQALHFYDPGWTNKMFVKADLMPHHIRITNVRVERLQDISDEDCLREGVTSGCKIYMDLADRECYGPTTYAIDYCDTDFPTPYSAFAALIDKVSGKGTWESNPWVVVYEFELVK